MSIRQIIRGLARRILRTNDVTNAIRKKRLVFKRRFYRRRFTMTDTRELLKKLGFVRGRIVWVQSSWNEFYNLAAKPSDLLGLMLDALGPSGTLVMPAFPIVQDATKI